MNLRELREVVSRPELDELEDREVRLGDVAEGSALHSSVGAVVVRGGGDSVSIVLTHGGESMWKDETLATDMTKVVLWGEEEQ